MRRIRKTGTVFGVGRMPAAGAIERGARVETEHEGTYERIESVISRTGRMPEKGEVFRWIATDHLSKFGDEYYKYLHQVERALKSGKRIVIGGSGRRGMFCIGFAASNHALERGMKVEAEHERTYMFMERYFEEHGRLPDKKVMFKMISTDHITEFPDYYTPLGIAMQALKAGRKIR